MNYYEHHLGDYLRDTAHLSMIEDGAYRRLLDAYYIRETPLPQKISDVMRLVRAQNKSDRDATETVLREFFTETPNGWTHSRCEQEISRFQGKRAKAKASADARWADSERNANAMRTHSERNAFGMPRARVPDTSHQTPDTIEEKDPPASRVPPVASPRPTKKCPSGFKLTEELRSWAKTNAPGVNIDRETEAFRDHTFGTARSDWDGTWRNWMRKAANQSRPNGNHASADIFGGAL